MVDISDGLVGGFWTEARQLPQYRQGFIIRRRVPLITREWMGIVWVLLIEREKGRVFYKPDYPQYRQWRALNG